MRLERGAHPSLPDRLGRGLERNIPVVLRIGDKRRCQQEILGEHKTGCEDLRGNCGARGRRNQGKKELGTRRYLRRRLGHGAGERGASPAPPPLTGPVPPPRQRKREAVPGSGLGSGAGMVLEALRPRLVRWALLAAFAAGVVVGWQAGRARRRFLRWRQRYLQRRLAAAQEKLEAA